MTLYRKKGTFEAKQLTEEDCWAYWLNGIPFFDRFSVSGSYHPGNRTISYASVYISAQSVFEQDQRASLGDWVVVHPNGYIEIMTAEEFASQMEEVPTAAQPKLVTA